MKLITHIQEQYEGNISAFAKTQDVRYSQVARWIKRDCYWINGAILCNISKRVSQK